MNGLIKKWCKNEMSLCVMPAIKFSKPAFLGKKNTYTTYMEGGRHQMQSTKGGLVLCLELG